MGAKKPLLLLLLLRLFLAAVLLLLPAEGHRRGQQSVPTSPSGAERGVKLCGREFIRAVVFTCGGSRWKRSSRRPGRSEQPALPSGARAEFAPMNSDSELENTKLPSILEPELEQLRSVSQSTGQLSLNDLFSLYDDYNEYIPTSDNFSEYIYPLEDAAHRNRGGPGAKFEYGFVGSNNWIRHPRRKCNFSMGVAGMCCKWGCTKTEISVLSVGYILPYIPSQ